MYSSFKLILQSILIQQNDLPTLGYDENGKQIVKITPQMSKYILTNDEISKIMNINQQIAKKNSIHGVDCSYFKYIAQKKPLVYLANQNYTLATTDVEVYVPQPRDAKIKEIKSKIRGWVDYLDHPDKYPQIHDTEQQVHEKIAMLTQDIEEIKKTVPTRYKYPANPHTRSTDEFGMPIGVTAYNEDGTTQIRTQTTHPYIPVIALFLTSYSPVDYVKVRKDRETGERIIENKPRVMPLIYALQEDVLGIRNNKFARKQKNANAFKTLNAKGEEQMWSANQLKSSYSNFQSKALQMCRRAFLQFREKGGDISVLVNSQAENSLGESLLDGVSLKTIWCTDSPNVIKNIYDLTLNQFYGASHFTGPNIRRDDRQLFDGMAMESKKK